MDSKHRSSLAKVIPGHCGAAFLACLVLGLLSQPAGAQQQASAEYFFSVEEEFVGFRFDPPNGNPIISDGDLLAVDLAGGCRIVARNEQLLQVFDIRFDLGLDAVVVPDPLNEPNLIAFSTSLDDPNGRFTAGDLLVTNGAIIPNNVLLANFPSVPPELDLGLDALDCRGDPKRCVEFFRSLDGRIDDPDQFLGLLQQFGIDILFSTEGTAPTPQQPAFIDGDLLSALAGAIAIPNSVLLAIQPAGIPLDGVDYGLDAFTRGQRTVGFTPPIGPGIAAPGGPVVVDVPLFSTEIVSIDRPVTFTDGDVLRIGAFVFLVNNQLISCFGPRVRDLGLDALHFGQSVVRECEITQICNRSVNDIDPVTGLASAVPCDAGPVRTCDRPFGRQVFIYGNVNFNPFLHEYRVTYDTVPSGGAPIGIVPSCSGSAYPRVLVGGCGPATVTDFLSDANGWISLNLSNQASFCNPLVPKTIWNSSSVPDGLYVLVLEVREIATGNIVCTSAPVRVVIDNTAPDCFLRSPQQVPPGGTAQIEGWVSDEHFGSYSVSAGSFSCGGGAFLPQAVTYPLFPNAPPVCHDGPGPVDCMGTTPSMTDINVFNVGPVAVNPGVPLPCCVAINMRTADRSCLGRCRTFNAAFPSLLFPALGVSNRRDCLDCFGVAPTAPIPLEVGLFQRGDANTDGSTDLSDGISILGFLFLGERELNCMKAADVNDSGIVDLSDASALFDALFRRGSSPPEPYGACGRDPTPDLLHCDHYEACSG